MLPLDLSAQLSAADGRPKSNPNACTRFRTLYSRTPTHMTDTQLPTPSPHLSRRECGAGRGCARRIRIQPVDDHGRAPHSPSGPTQLKAIDRADTGLTAPQLARMTSVSDRFNRHMLSDSAPTRASGGTPITFPIRPPNPGRHRAQKPEIPAEAGEIRNLNRSANFRSEGP